MADKDTHGIKHGIRMEESCPMSESDIADMDEVMDIEDSEHASGDGTLYVACRGHVIEAETAERMKSSFRAIIEAPYFAEKAERDEAFEQGMNAWLRSTVGRSLFMPDCNYLMSEVMDAAAFCEWPVQVEPDA